MTWQQEVKRSPQNQGNQAEWQHDLRPLSPVDPFARLSGGSAPRGGQVSGKAICQLVHFLRTLVGMKRGRLSEGHLYGGTVSDQPHQVRLDLDPAGDSKSPQGFCGL